MNPLAPMSLEALKDKHNAKWSTFAPDVLGMGIAEMDYHLATPIRARLAALLAAERTGYPMRGPVGPMADVAASFARRMGQRFGWAVAPGDTQLCVDLLQAIAACLTAYSDPGDGILIQTPCYPAFLIALDQGQRALHDVPMRDTPDGPRADPDPAATLAARGLRPRVLLLCHPHNPTGRVFTREELAPYIRLAEARDMVIISDEIHADLVFAPRAHQPLAQMFPEAAARIVTLYSASKSFNTPGLRCGIMHFGSAELMARFKARVPEVLLGLPSVGAMEATLAAWEECDDWLAALMDRLAAQRQQLVEALTRAEPRLRCFLPESTYFLWVDARAADLPGGPARFFLDRARVGVNDGAQCGPGWDGYVRFNYATTPALMDDLCARLTRALTEGR
ncbi:MalY/PatB family protein [Pararhodobacter aggregans]|uniref:cysteine-S-conjugate beta-lyase n=1 Tax=Pararhodobacter aggregans TaxID=404875 RepID=A0A2T7USS5_9RHOB|nr:aminotransferase class I/II-fold pyridoxal phosphate-dependent enzyme [Pararhodobacter aggregans]PTX03381.1 cystathionine beta-lyase [Pararhodobacter aggregans]PVE47676.1 hypothetical protein DDE23_09530 [Pararhodobacter aggregans]